MNISKDEIQGFMKGEDFIVISLANYGFLPMVKNWLYFIKKAGIENYVIFSLDKQIYGALEELNANTILLEHGKDLPKESQAFRSTGYNDIIHLKPAIVRDLLAMGINVLLSDADVVWVQNPIPNLKQGGFDIQIQIGERARFPNEEGAEIKNNWCNTGFFYVKSNEKTIRLFEMTLQGIEKYLRGEDKEAEEHPRNKSDEFFFNFAIRKHGGGLKVNFLNRQLFPTGVSLNPGQFEKFKRLNIELIVIHANCIRTMEEKIERLKNVGLWFE